MSDSGTSSDANLEKEHSELELAVSTLDGALLDGSVLYNAYASKYHLWDKCLSLMHAFRHADRALAERLWRSLIAAKVPRTSRDSETQQWLASPDFPTAPLDPKCGQLLEQQVTEGLFDEGEWTVTLLEAVGALGRELNGSRDVDLDASFPLEAVVGVLMRLATQLAKVQYANDAGAS